MIPDLTENSEEENDLTSDFEVETEPSKSYKLDSENSLIIGKVDDIEAIKQAVMKILSTERYEYEIYSWNYGIELKDLFGQSTSYVMAELEHRISDALTADDRIESISDYTAEVTDKKSILCSFTVNTVNSESFSIEKEVSI